MNIKDQKSNKGTMIIGMIAHGVSASSANIPIEIIMETKERMSKILFNPLLRGLYSFFITNCI